MDTDEHSSFSGMETAVNLTASFMILLGELQCKANITLADIQLLVDCMHGFLEDEAGFCFFKQ
jgi:hypothetical protein